MNVKWLIQEYNTDSFISSLKKEIMSQGMTYKKCTYTPFKKFASKDYNHFHDTECVIFYGTLNLARQIQKKQWVPGVYCNFNNFKCSVYYSYLGKHILNSDYIMLPLMEIIRRKIFLFNSYGVDNCIFMRSNSGSKTFTGGIFKKEKLEKEYDLLSRYAGKSLEDIICIISSPKKIKSEYRFVIINNKVITGSLYKKNNKLYESNDIDKKAWEKASEIAEEEW
ncbi:MAG: hypothetical protein ACOCP8_08835 [archaeon]